MRAPPSLSSWQSYPATSVTAVLAVGFSFLFWAKVDISNLFMDYHAWQGQLWRLVTSAFPHLDLIHLGFNLYWLWVFGTLVEELFGSLKTAALMLFFAAGSAASQHALSDAGVGLSGVGYGLFGLLWALRRTDQRVEETVDHRTVALFVGWFFFCIATTYAGVWLVGNVAHGMGVVLGLLVGLALSMRGQRLLLAGLSVAVFIAAILAGALWRPYLNWSSEVGQELAYRGYLELEDGNPQEAIDLYLLAVHRDEGQGDWWYNLGVAYLRLKRDPEAANALGQAIKRKPGHTQAQTALAGMKATQAHQSQTKEDHVEAVRLYREALALDEKNAENWFSLGLSYQHLLKMDSALEAYQRAIKLEPENAVYRAAENLLQARRERDGDVPPR